MHHGFIDRYARTDAPIQRLPAEAKALCALALVFASAFMPKERIELLAAPALVLALATALSRVPPKFVASRVLALAPFALVVASSAFLLPGGSRIFLAAIAKFAVSAWAVILMASTTPFSEIVAAMRRARLPSLLVTTLSLMYRYSFVAVDEAQRMSRALESRMFVAGRARAWRARAGMLGMLFVRSVERAERVYSAMLARGWR